LYLTGESGEGAVFGGEIKMRGKTKNAFISRFCRVPAGLLPKGEV